MVTVHTALSGVASSLGGLIWVPYERMAWGDNQR